MARALPAQPSPTPALSGTAKAAAILLSLNRELATRVLKFFDEDEIKIIAQAVNDLGSVSREDLDALIEELAAAIKSGGDFTVHTKKIQALLEGVLSPEQIEALLAQTGTRSMQAVWQQLPKIPDATLLQYLQTEHPQIIALVLSRAEPHVSAKLLAKLPRQVANEVVERMLSARPVQERAMVLLEMSFVQDVLLNRRQASELSSHARLADIINKMDRKLMDACMTAIAEVNEKDAELIRQQLFTFDDLSRLPTESLVILFDSIDPTVVINALTGAPHALKETILNVIPARMQRLIRSELEGGTSPKSKEVILAQRTIADLALQLLERGVIELDGRDQEEEF